MVHLVLFCRPLHIWQYIPFFLAYNQVYQPYGIPKLEKKIKLLFSILSFGQCTKQTTWVHYPKENVKVCPISYLQWFLSTFFSCNFFTFFFGNINTTFFISFFAIFLWLFFTFFNIFWFTHWFLFLKVTIFLRNFNHYFFRFPGFTFLANSFTICSGYGFIDCSTFFGLFRSTYFFWNL